MEDERFNMSLRKFLKHVGVTSQQEIERIVREKGLAGGKLHVRTVLTAEGTDLHHIVEGRDRFAGSERLTLLYAAEDIAPHGRFEEEGFAVDFGHEREPAAQLIFNQWQPFAPRWVRSNHGSEKFIGVAKRQDPIVKGFALGF